MPVHDDVVERAVGDGGGKSGARLRLGAALEAAEDGHVAGLQVGRGVRRDEAQHDVRELRRSWRPWWPSLAWMLAMSQLSSIHDCGREHAGSWSSWPSRSLT